MRNRAQWEKTWAKQREEDAKGVRLEIDVPPKYKKDDFLKGSYWSQRGKLDVPKERFISYPLASPDGDGSLLLGWAGWDHREQAHALMALIEDRSAKDGWGGEKLTPLIAGLAEVMPGCGSGMRGPILIPGLTSPRRTTLILKTRESGTAFPRRICANGRHQLPASGAGAGGRAAFGLTCPVRARRCHDHAAA